MRKGAKKEACFTSFCAYVFQFEGLWCLKGKYGVTLLNDVKIVIIIAEWAMKAIIVHFSQNKLKKENKEFVKNIYTNSLQILFMFYTVSGKTTQSSQ